MSSGFRHEGTALTLPLFRERRGGGRKTDQKIGLYGDREIDGLRGESLRVSALTCSLNTDAGGTGREPTILPFKRRTLHRGGFA